MNSVGSNSGSFDSHVQLDSVHAKFLRALLAIIGCGLLVAAGAVFLPVETMAKMHQWLGLGEFPDAPITRYLARSTSLLYAVHGALILFVSLDLKRYWPLAALLGWLHVVIGLTMLGIDLSSPMPLYWTAGEGLPIAAVGALIVYLWRKSNLHQPDRTATSDQSMHGSSD